MKILVIDTAGPIEMVAASADGRVADRTARAGISHSVTLFESIDAALRELGLRMRDINLIGVGVGPGSFTGIRIAVSTARMLSQITRAPLVGAPSTLLYAASAGASPGEDALMAFDAKKGRVFGALYRIGGAESVPEELVPPGDYKPETLASRAEAGRTTVLAGDGAERYQEAFARLIPRHRLVASIVPSGEVACGIIGAIYGSAPERHGDYTRIRPFYARRSDAEIARESRTGGGGRA